MQGESPLTKAVEAGRWHVVEVLMSHYKEAHHDDSAAACKVSCHTLISRKVFSITVGCAHRDKVTVGQDHGISELKCDACCTALALSVYLYACERGHVLLLQEFRQVLGPIASAGRSDLIEQLLVVFDLDEGHATDIMVDKIKRGRITSWQVYSNLLAHCKTEGPSAKIWGSKLVNIWLCCCLNHSSSDDAMSC